MAYLRDGSLRKDQKELVRSMSNNTPFDRAAAILVTQQLKECLDGSSLDAKGKEIDRVDLLRMANKLRYAMEHPPTKDQEVIIKHHTSNAILPGDAKRFKNVPTAESLSEELTTLSTQLAKKNEAWHKMNEAMVMAEAKKMDTNGDGKLSASEIVAGRSNIQSPYLLQMLPRFAAGSEMAKQWEEQKVTVDLEYIDQRLREIMRDNPFPKGWNMQHVTTNAPPPATPASAPTAEERTK